MASLCDTTVTPLATVTTTHPYNDIPSNSGLNDTTVVQHQVCLFICF